MPQTTLVKTTLSVSLFPLASTVLLLTGLAFATVYPHCFNTMTSVNLHLHLSHGAFTLNE